MFSRFKKGAKSEKYENKEENGEFGFQFVSSVHPRQHRVENTCKLGQFASAIKSMYSNTDMEYAMYTVMLPRPIS